MAYTGTDLGLVVVVGADKTRGGRLGDEAEGIGNVSKDASLDMYSSVERVFLSFVNPFYFKQSFGRI